MSKYECGWGGCDNRAEVEILFSDGEKRSSCELHRRDLRVGAACWGLSMEEERELPPPLGEIVGGILIFLFLIALVIGLVAWFVRGMISLYL